MKAHNKTHENVFSTDHAASKCKLNLQQITVGDMEIDDYTKLFQGFLDKFYDQLFLFCAQLSWMRRRFVYYGIKTVLPMHKNPLILNIAFVKFLRRNVGKDIMLVTRSLFFTKLEMYFDDLIPGFMDGNPFENPEYYSFPYKNISLDYLMVVHQLDERLELLKKADDDKMSYAVFVDYCINHVLSCNEELGRDRYQMRLNMDRDAPFFIRDTDKKLQAKKGRKRS